jgi:hypothetical protein
MTDALSDIDSERAKFLIKAINLTDQMGPRFEVRIIVPEENNLKVISKAYNRYFNHTFNIADATHPRTKYSDEPLMT